MALFVPLGNEFFYIALYIYIYIYIYIINKENSFHCIYRFIVYKYVINVSPYLTR